MKGLITVIIFLNTFTLSCGAIGRYRSTVEEEGKRLSKAVISVFSRPARESAPSPVKDFSPPPIESVSPPAESLPPPIVEPVPPSPPQGRILVRCTPVAACRLEELDAGKITGPQEAIVPAGLRRIKITAEGYEHAIRNVRVPPDRLLAVQVELKSLPARITFVSTPSGATVSVNGDPPLGVTPLEAVLVSPGRNRVRFYLEGYPDVIVERNLKLDVSERVEVEFKRLTGNVRFEAEEVWSELKIDGEPVKLDLGEWLELPPGNHTATAFRSSGRYVATANFDLPAGRHVTSTLSWRPWKPDPVKYAFMPTTTASLGAVGYDKYNPPRRMPIAAFWIARKEVTVAEYRACVEDDQCRLPGEGEKCNWKSKNKDSHPINCVSATDAENYAKWLSQHEGLQYRLPTSDEWERAARGEEGKRYPWGDDSSLQRCNGCDRLCQRHWARGSEDGWETTSPVGELSRCRGPEGVYDLVGNVAEWCREGVSSETYEIRGGSWDDMDAFLDPANRKKARSKDVSATIGFRLVVTDPQEP